MKIVEKQVQKPKKSSFRVELSFSDWCKNVCKYGGIRDSRFDWDIWNLWIEGNGRAEEKALVALLQADWEGVAHSPPVTFRVAINYAD